MTTTPSIADIEAARERLAGVARETPVYPTETFSRLTGRQVFLKAENLQRTGSFKIRGAYNTIATLGAQERRAGVVAASAGNHGQAVAWAAREAGIPATIFMPQDAPMAKVEATRSYGGTTELTGEAFEEAVAAASAYVESTGATLVHAFEDARVIAGQGTIGLELAEQAADGDGADPDRRRRTRRGDRHGAEGAAPRGSDRRCPVSAGIHDRGRDRRETPRRARVLDPRACPRRHGLRLGRRDLGGSRALRRADEVPGGGCGRRRARRAAGRSRAGSRLGRGRPLGWEHRRDDADLGDAARPHARGPIPRRPPADPRPSRRAAECPRPGRPRGRGNVVSVDHHREDGRRARSRPRSSSSSRRATRSTARSSSPRCAPSAIRSSGSALRRRLAAGCVACPLLWVRECRVRQVLLECGCALDRRAGRAGRSEGRHRRLRRPRRLDGAGRAARPRGRPRDPRSVPRAAPTTSSSGSEGRSRSSSATRSSASSARRRAHEDDPERAVRAALAIQDAIAELNEADRGSTSRSASASTRARRSCVGARPEPARRWSPAT